MSDGDTIVSNEFGSVYADRVGFYAKKGWFGGGVLEELPIRHVTSVRFETSRNWVLGVVLALIGIFALAMPRGEGILGAAILFVMALFVLWGSPKVTLNPPAARPGAPAQRAPSPTAFARRSSRNSVRNTRRRAPGRPQSRSSGRN